MWLSRIPGLSEAMRFKAAREVRFNVYKDISFYKMVGSQNGQMFICLFVQLTNTWIDEYQLTVLGMTIFT